MRDGKYIATENKENMTVEKIIRLMVGRELSMFYPERKKAVGEVLLSAENLSGEYTHLKNASLTLHKGEILGVAGLEGSGRSELLSAIFGMAKLESGKILLNGKAVVNSSPIEAIRNGFAFLTEERRATGIFGILDLVENTTISSLKRIKKGPFVSKKRQKALTEEYIRKMRVKTPSAKAKIQNLSGGNQQKVILARWLLTNPRVLLLDEPTRGVDVGAKYEIYTLINKLANDGRGVIIVSSEMAELLGIADRIAVMSGGRIAGVLKKTEATQESIMTLSGKYI
jgi:methyl-galactoside transport system ATP-binding protein